MLKFEKNVDERKTVALRLGELTGIHPYYTRAPHYAYQIGAYWIDRDGNLTVEEEQADPTVLGTLLSEGLIRMSAEMEEAAEQMQNEEQDGEQERTEEQAQDGEPEETELPDANDTEGEEAEPDTAPEETVDEPAETELPDTDDTEGEDAEPDTAAEETEDTDPVEDDSSEAADTDPAEDASSETEDTDPAEDASSEADNTAASENADSLDLAMSFNLPISQHTGLSLRNLMNLLYSRGPIVNKATGGNFRVEKSLVEALEDDTCTYSVTNFKNALAKYEEQHGRGYEGIEIGEEWVSFTGFGTAADVDHLRANGQLAILMNQQAISQKRIQAKEVGMENEKYAFRVWLIRLGMNGDEFKQARKLLMERLGGHAAFRTEAEAEKAKQKALAKRRAAKERAEEGQSDVDAAAEQDAAQPATAAQETIVEGQSDVDAAAEQDAAQPATAAQETEMEEQEEAV